MELALAIAVVVQAVALAAVAVVLAMRPSADNGFDQVSGSMFEQEPDHDYDDRGRVGFRGGETVSTGT